MRGRYSRPVTIVPLLSLPLAGREIGRMEPYGQEHVAVLTGIGVACVVLVPVARAWGHTRNGRAITRAAGWILLLVMITSTVGGWLPETWNVAESLPFHLSDWLRVILAIALITRAPWAVATSIFWGLTLNAQSVLTPDLRYFHNVPLEFLQYWFFHGLALVATVVLVWGFGYRPTWRGFGAAYLLTLAWAAVAMTVNALTGANYGYLAHPPAGASLLDVLGPWPWYVLVEVAVVAVVWALMTALFSIGRPRGAEVPGGLIWCAPVGPSAGQGASRPAPELARRR